MNVFCASVHVSNDNSSLMINTVQSLKSFKVDQGGFFEFKLCFTVPKSEISLTCVAYAVQFVRCGIIILKHLLCEMCIYLKLLI